MADAPEFEEPPPGGSYPPERPARSLTVIALIAELIALTSGSPAIVVIAGLLGWSIRCLLELRRR